MKKNFKPLRPYKPGQKIKAGRVRHRPGTLIVKASSVAQFYSQESIAAAFNKWQLATIQNPEQYKRDFEAAADFARQRTNGETPSYGSDCAAYLLELLREPD